MSGGIMGDMGDGDGAPVVASEGVAVVPDVMVERYGRDFIAALNGGGRVLTTSEALESES